MQSGYMAVLSRRRLRWAKVYQQTLERGKPPRRGRRLKRFIWKGIPDAFRLKMWMMLSGAAGHMEREPQAYAAALATAQSAGGKHADQIALDITRTFPEHPRFQQGGDLLVSLQHVLLACSHRHPEIGYCQGMNFVAGLLLLVAKGDEASAFWMLVGLLEHAVPGYYSPDMAAIQLDQHVLGLLIAKHLPEVHAKLVALDIDPMILFLKWFISMFIDSLPLESTLRVWDTIWLEGNTVIFRVALAILEEVGPELLQCRRQDEVLDKSKALAMRCVDCHALMRRAKKIKIKKSEIARLRRAAPT